MVKKGCYRQGRAVDPLTPDNSWFDFVLGFIWDFYSGVDFVLGLRAEFAMKGQFCTREFVSYNYSANHMSFLFK